MAMREPPLPQPPLGDELHSIVPGSVPLSNVHRERYARARVLGLSPIEAARKAGFTPGLWGTASKIERNAKVQARIKYLAGNTDEVLRQKRQFVEERLNVILNACIQIKNYTQTMDDGSLILDTSAIASLPKDKQRELLSAIKSFTPTQHGARIETYDLERQRNFVRSTGQVAGSCPSPEWNV